MDWINEMIVEEKLENIRNELYDFILQRVKHEDSLPQIMEKIAEYEKGKEQILNGKNYEN